MFLLLALALAARADDLVVVPPSALRGRPAEEAPVEAPVPYVVDRRQITVRPGADGRDEVQVEVIIGLRPLRPGWVGLPLLQGLTLDSATVNGAPLSLPPGPDGWRHAVLRLSGPVELRITGRARANDRALSFSVTPAARSFVQVDTKTWDWEFPGGVPARGGFDLGPSPQITLSWAPAGTKAPRPLSVRGEVEAALRGEVGEATGSATLRWRVAHGVVSFVEFDLPGGATSLEVEGPGIQGFTTQGDRVRVTLDHAERSLVTAQVRWRAAGPAATPSAAPVPMPIGSGVKGFVTLLRGDDAVLVPQIESGLRPAASRALPPDLLGRLDGRPVGSWTVEGASPRLRWQALDVSPIDGPPTVVDAATYRVYWAPEGGLALQADLTVRNDRSAYLRVVLPAGSRLLAAKVAGRVVNPVDAGQGAIWVPLEKSVETVTGLVSMPVQLLILGSAPSLREKGRPTLPLPILDAPLNAATVELHLPGEVLVKKVEGSTRAPTTDSGDLVIGHAVGVAGGEVVEKQKREGQSNDLWSEAYRAYKDNRFDEADRYLQQSLEINPDNQSAQALRGNVDVLLNKTTVEGKDDVGGRRLREMAQARSLSDEVAQEKLKSQAESLERAGQVDEAIAVWGQLVEVTNNLAVVEQVESTEQKENLSSYQSRYSSLVAEKSKSKARPSSSVMADRKRIDAVEPAKMMFEEEAEEADKSFEDDGERTIRDLPEGLKEDANGYFMDGLLAGDVQGDDMRVDNIPVEAPPPPPAAPRPAPARGGGGGFTKNLKSEELRPDSGRMVSRPAAAPAPAAPVVTLMPPPVAKAEEKPAFDSPSSGEDLGWTTPVEEPMLEPPMEASLPEAVTMTQEFLEKIPAGRSYQSVTVATAGLVAADPAPAQVEVIEKDVLQRLPIGRSYQAAAQTATGTTGKMGGKAPVKKAEAARRPPAAEDDADRAQLDDDERVAVEAEVLVSGRRPPGWRVAQATRNVISALTPDPPPPRPRPTPHGTLITIPEGVSAATLGLSLPALPQILTLEQQLLAPSQPILIELRCSPRRHP